MGRDKALVPWQGVPLIRRVGTAAASCASAVYVLTPWPERYRAVVAPDCSFLDESHPGQGPLVALADGLGQIPPVEWVLLLACDLPQLQPTILQGWRDRLSLLPDRILAAVPQRLPPGRRSHRRWEPLCGFYRPTIQPQLEDFIQRGGRSFQNFLTAVEVRALPVGEREAQMLRNCNSPDDF